jgi:hypothetical protein
VPLENAAGKARWTNRAYAAQIAPCTASYQ